MHFIHDLPITSSFQVPVFFRNVVDNSNNSSPNHDLIADKTKTLAILWRVRFFRMGGQLDFLTFKLAISYKFLCVGAMFIGGLVPIYLKSELRLSSVWEPAQIAQSSLICNLM